MKRVLLGIGVTVLLCTGTLFWGPVSDSMSDAAYNTAHALRYLPMAVVTDASPELEKHLTRSTPSGSISSRDSGFSWSSWRHGDSGPYYYRFENLGGRTVYARSRLFTKLIGSTRLQLAPKQVIYFGLVDSGPSTWLTERVDYSEHDSVLASTGGGTSMTLVMPDSLR